MPEGIEFRSTVLAGAYADAQKSLRDLPDAEREQKLGAIATELLALDRQEGLSATQLRARATQIVSSHQAAGPAGGPVLRTPEPTRTDPNVVRAVDVAPGVAIAAGDGMPLIDGKRPTTRGELADALYGFARAIDARGGDNLVGALPQAQRKALVETLEQAIAGRLFSDSPELTTQQAAQLRASIATLLAETVEAQLSADTPAGRQLLVASLNAGAQLTRAETYPGLQQSMAFGLYRFQTKLPEELRSVTRELMRDVGGLAPPYEKWIADGKVDIDMVVDGDADTISEAEGYFGDLGFTLVPDTNPKKMTKTLGEGDDAVVVEVTIRQGSSRTFDRINDDDVDIVMYSGHSSYARAMPKAIANADAGRGADKLVVLSTCFGKDNMQHVHAQYPESMVIGTLRSATDTHQLTVTRALLDGIEHRKSWAGISRRLGSTRSSNWVLPSDPILRRRILDSDGDGRADLFDRVFDVNLQNVEHSLRKAFEPKAPEAPLHPMQGRFGVVAANWMNRGAGGYNEAIRSVTRFDGVSSTGYFEGAKGDPPVRFAEKTLEDGKKIWTLALNDRFAHMPEEVLRAVTAWEYNDFLAKNESGFSFHGDMLEARVNGLMTVAFTLSHDNSYNDRKVWQQLLEAYNLPEISMHDVESYASRHATRWNDNDAGSRAAVEDFIKEMTENNPDLIEALSADDAGVWQPPK